MQIPLSSKLVVRSLIGLALFSALSALLGSLLGVALNGAGVPLEYLAGSPFTSYFVPGLILGVVIGGTQAAAAIALLKDKDGALLVSAVAGFGLLIWVFVELAVIRQYSWLQTAYFALGGLELILVLALLGIVPRLVKPRQSSRNPSGTSPPGQNGCRPDRTD